MRREELASILNKPYTAERGFGVEKISDPAYSNLYFVTLPPPPREVPKNLNMQALAKAYGALMQRPEFDCSTPTDQLINRYCVRREAVQSSRMEGTWSTVDALFGPAVSSAEGGRPGDASAQAYATTLDLHANDAFSRKEAIFSVEFVQQIHAAIIGKDPTFHGIPGALREPGKPGAVVLIGGLRRKEESIFNPAPPQRVKPSLAKVMAWLSDKDLAARGDAGIGGFSLPVRIAIGHAHFEGVHPFSDGNGRVGRALWALQMIAAGRMPLYISGYIEEEAAEYSRALQLAQKQLDYGLLVEFIATAIYQSALEVEKTKQVALSLPETWHRRAKFRRHSASQRALALLLEKPIITAEQLIEDLNISEVAAHGAIKQLVERHIVRARGKIGRQTYYAAEELLALLSRRFSADPEEAVKGGYHALRTS